MQNVLNNVTSMQQTKESIEKTAIAIAIRKGHMDPYADSDISKLLEFTWNGKTYRRYIEGFDYIPYSTLQSSQVRNLIVDKDYCVEKLAPLIKKAGIVNHPVMITPSGEIKHGHHRAYSTPIALGPTTPVPCFTLSRDLYEVKDDGEAILVSHGAQQFLYKTQTIQVNPEPKNKEYCMEDVALQCKQLVELDPAFGGLLSGALEDGAVTREDFNKLMDALHPKQFLTKGTRTKIWKRYIRGNPLSQVKDIDEADILLAMIQAGWKPKTSPSKNKQLQKLNPFLENWDEQNNMHIMTATDQGHDFERHAYTKVFPTKKEDLDPDGEGTVEIALAVYIKKPKFSFVELQKQREVFEKRVEAVNEVFERHGRNIKFTKILFLSQLTLGVNDPDTVRVVK